MDKDLLGTLTEAEVDWAYNYLVFTGLSSRDVIVTDQKERKKNIEDVVQTHLNNNADEGQRILAEIHQYRQIHALEKHELDWLDPKNRLQCVFVWGAIQALFVEQVVIPRGPNRAPWSGILEQSNKVIIDPTSTRLDNPFMRVMGKLFLHTNDDIVFAFNDFFQRWDETRDVKLLALRELKNRYNRLQHYGNHMSWLSVSDFETRRWAWVYLQSKDIPTDYLIGDEWKVEVEHLMVAFELWTGHPAEKELIHTRMKAAASQRKTRLKRRDRKPYQIFLTKDHKKRLDDLAWRHDRKIYEVVEHLIDKAIEEGNTK